MTGLVMKYGVELYIAALFVMVLAGQFVSRQSDDTSAWVIAGAAPMANASPSHSQ